MKEGLNYMVESNMSNEQQVLGLQFQEYIKTIDPHIFGFSNIDGVSCKPLNGGHSNVTYLAKVNDKPFVLRFHPKSDEGGDHTADEYSKLRQVGGLHAPKALHLGRPDFIDSSVLIMEFAKGEHKNFNELSPAEVKNFAHAVADIHNITREGVFSKTPDEPEDMEGTYYDYAQSWVDNNVFKQYIDGKIPDEIRSLVPDQDRDVIRQAREKLQAQMQQHRDAFSGTTFSYLHNDIVVLNVLWNSAQTGQSGQPTLIDWEVPSFGDRADEVAYIFAINNTSPEFERTFLDEYERHVDDPKLRERIGVYKLKNRLMDVAWSVGKLHEEASDKNPLMKKEEGLYKKFYEDRFQGLRDELSG